MIWQHNLAAGRAEDEVAAAAISVERSDAELVELVLTGNEAAFAAEDCKENFIDEWRDVWSRK